jgi:hypothetical protein
MATLRLPTHAAEKVAPRLGVVGLDPAKAAAREAARQAAEAAAAKAAAEAEARAAAEAQREAEKAANLAAEEANRRRAQKERRNKRDQCFATVRARWPDLFKPHAPLPLAVGTTRLIAKTLDVSPRIVGPVIHVWTQRPEYLAAVAAGGMRYNLDGTEAGPISEEHQAHAAEQLPAAQEQARARKERRAERRKPMARAA